MQIIAGIDEAGYGPTLGPLVVTSTVFSLPDDCKNNLWELLEDVVSLEISRNNGKIVVTDSKKVYSASKGLRRLEDAVLSFMLCLKRDINSFKDLLKFFSDIKEDSLDIYPWYRERDITLPIASNRNSISNYADSLLKIFNKEDVELIDITSVPVSVYDFNNEVDKVGNKAVVLFNKCAKLLIDVWDRFGESTPKVYIDKHGGRNYYLPLLYPVFEGNFIRTHKEGDLESVYEVIGEGKKMFISFVQGSETKHFPIALSSMCCKYIREVYMKLFNQFWKQEIPDIKPTAGYYTDAKRFLAEIADVKEALCIKDELMIRVK
ncbi:MAG: hypothetical protein ACUZ8O_12265 [Candidatus Anammoxibacter sp.]